MSFKCPCNAGQLCYVPYPFNRINKTGFSSGINGGQAHHVKLKPMAKLYYGLDFTHLHVREVSIMRTVIVCVLFSFVQKGLSLLVTVSIDERHTRRHPHKILGRTESGELSWTDLNNLQYHLPEGKKKKKKKDLLYQSVFPDLFYIQWHINPCLKRTHVEIKTKESDLEPIKKEKCKLERSFLYNVSSKANTNKVSWLFIFFLSWLLLFVNKMSFFNSKNINTECSVNSCHFHLIFIVSHSAHYYSYLCLVNVVFIHAF